MAIKIGNFVGWETGGLEEADIEVDSGASVGTTNPTPNFGAFRLKIATGPSAIVKWSMLPPGAVDSGGLIIIGTYIQVPSITAESSITILVAGQNSDLRDFLSIQLNHLGEFRLVDSVGAIIDSKPAPFSANVWVRIEVVFNPIDGGNAEVFVDDVLQLNGIGDYLPINGNIPGAVKHQANFFDSLFIDGGYCLTGATSSDDRLGTFEIVGPYQNTLEDATDVGDTLDIGTWANVSETPVNDTNTGEYTVSGAKTGGTTTDEGIRSGPSGDSRIDGATNIKAGKYIYKLKRGACSPTTHGIRFGNNVDGMTDKFKINASFIPVPNKNAGGLTVLDNPSLACHSYCPDKSVVPALNFTFTVPLA